MAKLVNFTVIDLPDLFAVGKVLQTNMAEVSKANPIPAFWDACFTDGTFNQIEKSSETLYNPDYIGLMYNYNAATGDFCYMCGMLLTKEYLPSSDFRSYHLEPIKTAISWIRGADTIEICSKAHDLSMKAIHDEGYDWANAAGWVIELYNCPRFTSPDSEGHLILDYYVPIQKSI